jgi:hypothetical protein
VVRKKELYSPFFLSKKSNRGLGQMIRPSLPRADEITQRVSKKVTFLQVYYGENPPWREDRLKASMAIRKKK